MGKPHSAVRNYSGARVVESKRLRLLIEWRAAGRASSCRNLFDQQKSDEFCCELLAESQNPRLQHQCTVMMFV
jgi:hypothetical protein